MTTYAGHWGPEPFIDRTGRARPDADVYDELRMFLDAKLHRLRVLAGDADLE